MSTRLEKVSLSLGPGEAETSVTWSPYVASVSLMQEIQDNSHQSDDGNDGLPEKLPEDNSICDTNDCDTKDNDEDDEATALSDEVRSVYDQIRTLVHNLKRTSGHQRPGTSSLVTSIGSSGSDSDMLSTQFRVSQGEL